MMLLSTEFIVSALFVTQLGYVVLAWISHRGMWYYISENGVLVNYESAHDKCAQLDGQLVTIVNKDQLNFISNMTRSAHSERYFWIGYSTMYNPDKPCDDNRNMWWAEDDRCSITPLEDLQPKSTCSAAVMYIGKDIIKTMRVQTALCSDTYGYICQWQCRAFYVGSQIANTTGIYAMQGYNNMRKSYKSADVYNRTFSFKDDKWSIFESNSSLERMYQYTHEYVPYYIPEWRIHITSKSGGVNFVCTVCKTYTIRITGFFTKLDVVLYKEPLNEYVYRHKNRYTLTLYDGLSASWCFRGGNMIIFCTNYTIHPDVTKEIRFTRSSPKEIITISIHCGLENPNELVSSKSTTLFTETTTVTPTLKSSPSLNHITTPITSSYTSAVSSIISVLTANGDTADDIVHSYKTQPVTYKYETTTVLSTVDTQIASSRDQQNLALYIGVPCGILLLIVVVIATVMWYKRRQPSATALSTNSPHLNDKHAVTEFNIYADHNESTNVYADITPHMPSHSSMSNVVGRANVPVPESVSPTQRSVDKGFVQNSTKAVPIYATVSKDRPYNSQIPRESLYSKVDKAAENVLNISDAHLHHKSNPATNIVHDNDSNKEEYSDNDIYEKSNKEQSICSIKDCSYMAKIENTNLKTVTLSTTVLNDLVFYEDDADDEVEMYDNDVYGQQL